MPCPTSRTVTLTRELLTRETLVCTALLVCTVFLVCTVLLVCTADSLCQLGTVVRTDQARLVWRLSSLVACVGAIFHNLPSMSVGIAIMLWSLVQCSRIKMRSVMPGKGLTIKNLWGPSFCGQCTLLTFLPGRTPPPQTTSPGTFQVGYSSILGVHRSSALFFSLNLTFFFYPPLPLSSARMEPPKNQGKRPTSQMKRSLNTGINIHTTNINERTMAGFPALTIRTLHPHHHSLPLAFRKACP